MIRKLRGILERYGGTFGFPSNGIKETFGFLKDEICLWVQPLVPSSVLTFATSQPNHRGKCDENWVKGSPAFDVPPGIERGQARTRGTSFMQETVLGGVEGCDLVGGGMFDHHRATANKEVRRGQNNQLVFVIGILHGVDHCVLRK